MTPSLMKPDEFKSWRKRQNMSMERCGETLGLSAASICFYEAGERPDRKEPVEIPLVVTWAMLAIEKKLDNKYTGRKR